MIQLFLNQFIPEACLANNVIETFSRLYHRKGRSADARILVAEVGAWRIQSSVNCLAARAAISPGLDYKVFHSELIAPRHLCTTTPNSIAVIFLHSAFLVPESLTPSFHPRLRNSLASHLRKAKILPTLRKFIQFGLYKSFALINFYFTFIAFLYLERTKGVVRSAFSFVQRNYTESLQRQKKERAARRKNIEQVETILLLPLRPRSCRTCFNTSRGEDSKEDSPSLSLSLSKKKKKINERIVRHPRPNVKHSFDRRVDTPKRAADRVSIGEIPPPIIGFPEVGIRQERSGRRCPFPLAGHVPPLLLNRVHPHLNTCSSPPPPPP